MTDGGETNAGTAIQPTGVLSRRRIGIVLGPVLFAAVLVAPLPALSSEAHRLAAILALVIVFWVTEVIPLPVTALLGPVLAVLLGVAPVDTALAPMANPLIFLFLGSFMLSQALFVHRVNERIAYTLLSSPFVGARPRRVLLTYGLVAAFLSAWMSNTATAAMLVPIALSLLTFMETEGKTPRSYGTALLLMTTYGTSRGGMSTPVGTPPNLIAVGMLAALAGVQISFLQWMMVAVPVSLTLLAIVTTFLIYVGRVGPGEIRGVDTVIADRARALGPIRRGELNALIAFGVTVFLWIGPGLLPLVLGAESEFARQVARLIPESVAALTGAVLLFLLPVSETQRSTLTWKEAAQIDWGTLLLFGGGLALGTLAGSTGLAEAIGRGVTNVFPADSTLGLAFAAAIFAVLLSETMSNTAAANIAVPVVISIALAAGLDPVAPALTAALAASVADALPVSTPPNAIVYATGKVPITLMVRYGVVLDGSATIVVPSLVVLLSWLLL